MKRKTPSFGIDKAEYEQQRNVFDMCRWINEKLLEIDEVPDSDSIYFERRGLNVKKFIEEVIPVAALGLYFYRPPDTVLIQCLTGNQGYDAILQVQGAQNFNIRVEATTTETPDDSVLRRQSLSRHGFTFSSGPIRREGRDIVQEPEMADYFEQEDQWNDRAFEALESKLQYNAYGPETAILVRMDTHRAVSLDSRAHLIRRTAHHLEQATARVYGVYYFYARNFIIDGVRTSDLNIARVNSEQA